MESGPNNPPLDVDEPLPLWLEVASVDSNPVTPLVALTKEIPFHMTQTRARKLYDEIYDSPTAESKLLVR